jgi:hypothetical protein
MDTKRILADLRAERSQIDRAIAAIEGLDTTSARTPRGGRPAAVKQAAPKARRGRRRLTAAARKRLSEAMKARWADRKKKGKSTL